MNRDALEVVGIFMAQFQLVSYGAAYLYDVRTLTPIRHLDTTDLFHGLPEGRGDGHARSAQDSRGGTQVGGDGGRASTNQQRGQEVWKFGICT